MQLRINSETYDVDIPSTELLLWTLRDELGLMGTKFGCGIGYCGACTVHVDGEATRACMTTVSNVEGKEIRTIEGLATIDENDEEILHPVQQAFIDEQVPQCSWCMSGQMMTAAAFLEQNPEPSEEEVIEAMAENYCRCGCYVRIKAAVVRAGKTLTEEVEHEQNS
ncbi:MAG: (2Fe-2S)-binding protein [Chloroflexi bacterium AL-W]|nr:(2Fe-2S)-binding protein [Chloroflexi bacterium AL-N1]NOK70480.1 (2Fe-2S)-binding protein [Chloroflexi bacterium AL-N10]NOK78161.1 (2Fe-2S)-binding protein [Chloroflexi bacterium AL-N5]NOK85260.1 (2Fe-2S)-binding protein [Chloroflexi bacterium AL-W]NOK92025.1 (2Fe-2S)-binding protein [Chloroflexi bacterium AL-N15]